jgi:hypothetical protein
VSYKGQLRKKKCSQAGAVIHGTSWSGVGKAQGGAEARQGAPAGGREEPKKGDPRAGPWQAFRVGAGSKGSREAIPPVAGASELGFSASWGCHKSPRRAFVTVTKGRTCPLRWHQTPRPERILKPPALATNYNRCVLIFAR